jgi:hypothetical protein
VNRWKNSCQPLEKEDVEALCGRDPERSRRGEPAAEIPSAVEGSLADLVTGIPVSNGASMGSWIGLQ